MDFHPLSEDYPLMPAVELGRIEEAMRERGFDPRFPIVRYQKKILDGRNRWLAAEKAGVKPLFVDFKGTEDEARLFVQTANEERRHLAAEWLHRRREERIGRVAAARQEGKSLRTIADEENVSESQVRADLDKATAQGCAVEPAGGQVTGKDGRKRSAPKPKKSAAVQPCDRCRRLNTPACDACRAAFPDGFPKPEDPPPATDDEGSVIPAQAVEAFANRRNIESLCRDIDGLLRRIEEAAKAPGGRMIRMESVRQHLKDAKGTLWANRPTHVCPYCDGKKDKCDCCKGEGWTAKHVWQQAPGVGRKGK